jgi:hypothetical protein
MCVGTRHVEFNGYRCWDINDFIGDDALSSLLQRHIPSVLFRRHSATHTRLDVLAAQLIPAAALRLITPAAASLHDNTAPSSNMATPKRSPC